MHLPGAEGLSSHGSYGWSGQEALLKSCGLWPALLGNCAAPATHFLRHLQIHSPSIRDLTGCRSVIRLKLQPIVRLSWRQAVQRLTVWESQARQAGKIWGFKRVHVEALCWTRHMLLCKAFLNLLEAGVEGGASGVFTKFAAAWTSRASYQLPFQVKYLLTSELTKSHLPKGADIRSAPCCHCCHVANPF